MRKTFFGIIICIFSIANTHAQSGSRVKIILTLHHDYNFEISPDSMQHKYFSGRVPSGKVLVIAWPTWSESEDRLTFFATRDEFTTLKKELKKSDMQITLSGHTYVKYVPCKDCRYIIE